MNYVNCNLCPRRCGVDRTRGQTGFCGAGDLALVAKAMIHKWEEPVLAGKGGSGTIFFGDDDVTELSTENRGIGLVFQNYALYPHMTVKQNILFPLENLKGKDKLTKEELTNLAEGGLCQMCKACHWPNCTFGRY